ncbi:type II secretion system F family protein [Gordonia zhaorongruii]|uniref:type II secretion system F family protein n=1 Tax=Gordonia zhaorongruii TaxID=2597659 RepID=UPI00104BAD5D|nr:type II secretion system F family protein [Gordonia zhaorongruii]
MSVLLGALLAAAGLWAWPAPHWTLARVAARDGRVREARWLGRHRGGPDPFDIASAYDLFAVCLRAGLPVSAAAQAAAEHAPPAIADPLSRTADLLGLGADSEVAWDDGTLTADGAFTDLATLARRASRSGSSFADGVAELAVEIRRREADRAMEAAEKAGVKVSGPLGLCFLPAFVCLGIAPVVIGLADGMLVGI